MMAKASDALARRLNHHTLPDCIRDLANQVEQVFAWLT
jgi:hypothetical protein